MDDLTIRQARDQMFPSENAKCACGCGRPVPDEEAADENSPGFVDDGAGNIYASWACFNSDVCASCGERPCLCAGEDAELEHEAAKYDDFPQELEYEDPADDFPAGNDE
jgi:hypothetical protein